MAISSKLLEQLGSLAGECSVAGSKEVFARELAAGLRDAKSAPFWSSLDIRAEFAARDWGTGSDSAKWRRSVRSAVPALYLVPVALTWFHLAQVVGEFRSFTASQRDGSYNLLTFWSGGYGGAYSHMPLGTVAWLVFVALAVIALSQYWVTYKDDGSHQARDSELNSIITQLGVASATLRAVSPEQLQKTFETATSDLRATIDSITSTLDASESLVVKITASASSLDDSVNAMRDAAQGFSTITKPLQNVAGSLQNISDTMTTTVKSLSTLETSITQVAHTIGVRLLESFGGYASQIDAATGRVGRVAQSMDQSSAAAAMVVENLDQLSKKTEGMLIKMRDATYENPDEPLLRPLLEIAQLIKDSVHGVSEAVNQIKAAADLFRAENERATNFLLGRDSRSGLN